MKKKSNLYVLIGFILGASLFQVSEVSAVTTNDLLATQLDYDPANFQVPEVSAVTTNDLLATQLGYDPANFQVPEASAVTTHGWPPTHDWLASHPRYDPANKEGLLAMLKMSGIEKIHSFQDKCGEVSFEESPTWFARIKHSGDIDRVILGNDYHPNSVADILVPDNLHPIVAVTHPPGMAEQGYIIGLTSPHDTALTVYGQIGSDGIVHTKSLASAASDKITLILACTLGAVAVILTAAGIGGAIGYYAKKGKVARNALKRGFANGFQSPPTSPSQQRPVQVSQPSNKVIQQMPSLVNVSGNR